MKKIIVAILLALVVLYGVFIVGTSLVLGTSQKQQQETFLVSSTSPDEKYTLEAYRTEPGATVDFSVKVYLVAEKDRTLVYNAYHQSTADILWIDNETVSINEKILNIANGDIYDWRKQ